MNGVLVSSWFQVVVVPLLLMLVGVNAKRLARRDGDTSPALNDCAVGTTLLLMVLGIILGDMRNAPGQVAVLIGWVAVVLCTIFMLLDHDRFRSWKRDPQNGNKPTDTKRLWAGVVVPDALSLTVFMSYQAHKVGFP